MAQDKVPQQRRSRSLAGQFQFIAALIVSLTIGVGVSILIIFSYQISKEERNQAISAIGTGLTRLVARPVSLGDYLSLEDEVAGTRLPVYICSVAVLNKSHGFIAGTKNRNQGLECDEKSTSITFNVVNDGELKSNTTNDSIGQVVLSVNNSDLIRNLYRELILATVIGSFIIALLIILSRIAIRQTLKPVSRALDLSISNKNPDPRLIDIAPIELKPVLEKMYRLTEEQRKLETTQKIAQVAAQVAHDIRSPLSALNLVVSAVKGIPEQQRTLLKQASDRINDIANDLLSRSRQSTLQQEGQDRSVHLISPLLESVVSEKRIQLKPSSKVRLEYESSSSYGDFSFLQPRDFLRIISNIIDNGIEAMGDSGGRLSVRVQNLYPDLRIEISDEGPGIPPEILPELGQLGKTFGKKGSVGSGFGLGLYHAKTTLESWGGKLEIQSVIGKGTCVRIILPSAPSPRWFLKVLEVRQKQRIAIVDDDTSIHELWKARFSSMVGFEPTRLIHFFSPEEVIKSLQVPGSTSDCLYLIDYEFSGNGCSGIELIEKLNISAFSVLVTGRFEESSTVKLAEKINVPVLPKPLIASVPII